MLAASNVQQLVCREAGAQVATNVSLRDLNKWQGAQIAVGTTIVGPLRRDGEPRPQADREPGLALALRQAVDRKLLAYPELRYARLCKLVVFEVELGGRFNFSFLRLRARQRAPWCATAGPPWRRLLVDQPVL